MAGCVPRLPGATMSTVWSRWSTPSPGRRQDGARRALRRWATSPRLGRPCPRDYGRCAHGDGTAVDWAAFTMPVSVVSSRVLRCARCRWSRLPEICWSTCSPAVVPAASAAAPAGVTVLPKSCVSTDRYDTRRRVQAELPAVDVGREPGCCPASPPVGPSHAAWRSDRTGVRHGLGLSAHRRGSFV